MSSRPDTTVYYWEAVEEVGSRCYSMLGGGDEGVVYQGLISNTVVSWGCFQESLINSVGGTVECVHQGLRHSNKVRVCAVGTHLALCAEQDD